MDEVRVVTDRGEFIMFFEIKKIIYRWSDQNVHMVLQFCLAVPISCTEQGGGPFPLLENRNTEFVRG